MAEAFDPYHIWLGIPPEEQPADYYRLLGIRRFESNGDVIANAADQRVRHLRSMQTGKRQAESQRLLNEIAVASGLLLDPDQRKEYDAKLRSRLPAAVSAPRVVPVTTQASAKQLAGIASTSVSIPAIRPISPGSKDPQKKLLLVGGAILATIATMVVVALIFIGTGSGGPTAGKTYPQGEKASRESNLPPGGSVTTPPDGGPKVVPASPPTPVVAQTPPTTPPPSVPPPPPPPDPEAFIPLPELQGTATPGWMRKFGYFSWQGTLLRKDGKSEGFVPGAAPSPETTFELGGMGLVTLAFEQACPPTYLLQIRATRLSGSGELAIDVVGDRNPTCVIIDRPIKGTFRSGMEINAGTPLSEQENKWNFVDGQLAKEGEPVTIIIAVESVQALFAQVTTIATATPVARVAGFNATSMTPRSGERAVAPNRLGLTTRDSRFLIQQVLLVPLVATKQSAAVAAARKAEKAARPIAAPAPVQDVQSSSLLEHQKNWEYGYGRLNAAGNKVVEFHPLVFSAEFHPDGTSTVRWGVGPHYPPAGPLDILHLRKDGGHTANDPSIVVIRRWRHTAKCVIKASGELEVPERGGDGVHVRLVTGNGERIWDAKDRGQRVSMDVNEFVLEENEPLDLCVDSNINHSFDTFKMRLHLAARFPDGKKEEWDSIADYRDPLPAVPMPAAVEVAKPARFPIPDEALLTAARGKLKETFGDLAQKSKKPEEKMKLFAELRAVADSEKDPAIRYVLLDTARHLALGAQDVQAALLVAGEIAKYCEADLLNEQLQTLKLAVGGTLSAAARDQAVQSALALAESSRDIGRVEVADAALLLAVDLAAKGKNLEQRKQAKQVRDTVLAYKRSVDLVKEAEATLKTKPDDAAANLVVGKWRCFVLEDWKAGLPHLEKCGEPALAAAATAEKDPKNTLAIADAWYAALGKLQGADRSAAQRRAQASYAQAAKELTGLDQLRAGKRAEELQSVTGEKTAAKTASTPVIAADDKLELGLIVRIVSGSQAIPTPILGTSMSWDGIVWDNVEVESRKVLELRGISASPLATGYIELDTDDRVIFTLRNAYCLIDGANFPPLVAAQKGEEPSYFGGRVEAKFEKQLTKGRHTLVIGRIPINTGSGIEFRVKRKGGGDCVFHSPKALEAELAKSIRLPGGGTSKGILLFGNLKFSR